MKKVIALCLAIVLVLSIVSLCLAGGWQCTHCGKCNAACIDYRISYSPANSNNHNIIISYQLYCPDCHSCYWKPEVAGQEAHCHPTHYHQTLGPHLIYEYDICGVCGGTYNSYTHTY